jgi:hypothetical protein
MTIDPPILALAVAVILQLIVVAFWAGILTARVRNLERQMEPMSAMAANVGVLGNEIGNFKRELEDLNRSLAWMKHPDPRMGPHGLPT